MKVISGSIVSKTIGKKSTGNFEPLFFFKREENANGEESRRFIITFVWIIKTYCSERGERVELDERWKIDDIFVVQWAWAHDETQINNPQCLRALNVGHSQGNFLITMKKSSGHCCSKM